MSTPRLTELIEKEQENSFAFRAARGELYGFSIASIDSSFDIAAPIKVLFKVGDKKVHIRRALSVLGGSATLVAYRTPTVTNDGSPVAIYNQHDSYSDVDPLMTVFSGTEVSANGTQCFEPTSILGSSTVPSKTTISLSDNVSRVLDANTEYLVVITAAADNEHAVYACQFFEAY